MLSRGAHQRIWSFCKITLNSSRNQTKSPDIFHVPSARALVSAWYITSNHYHTIHTLLSTASSTMKVFQLQLVSILALTVYGGFPGFKRHGKQPIEIGETSKGSASTAAAATAEAILPHEGAYNEQKIYLFNSAFQAIGKPEIPREFPMKNYLTQHKFEEMNTEPLTVQDKEQGQYHAS
jgi:hypothetical protein